MTLSLAGHQTQCVTFGSGPAPAVLLHCTLGHAGAYAKLAEGLSDLVHITSFDQPEHGRAAPWTGEGDLQDYVLAMTRELVEAEAARTGQRIHMIGHSFGGTVAVRLAQEAPDLLASLTLIEPVMVATAYLDHPQMKAQQSQVLSDFYAAMEREDRDTAARLFSALFGDGRPWEAIPEKTRASIANRIHMIVAGDRAVHEDCYGLASGKPLYRETLPTLLMNSTTGGPVMEATFAGLKKRIPQARHVLFAQKDIGHMLPLTHPELVSSEIRAFWTGIA